jgi:hypothetical protein
MRVYVLGNRVKRSEEWNTILSDVEGEDLVLPNCFYAVQLLIDFILLLGAVDQFGDIFAYFKELKLNQISEAELIRLEWD